MTVPRLAVAADLTAVEAIVARAYGHCVARIGKPPRPMLMRKASGKGHQAARCQEQYSSTPFSSKAIRSRRGTGGPAAAGDIGGCRPRDCRTTDSRCGGTRPGRRRRSRPCGCRHPVRPADRRRPRAGRPRRCRRPPAAARGRARRPPPARRCGRPGPGRDRRASARAQNARTADAGMMLSKACPIIGPRHRSGKGGRLGAAPRGRAACRRRGAHYYERARHAGDARATCGERGWENEHEQVRDRAAGAPGRGPAADHRPGPLHRRHQPPGPGLWLRAALADRARPDRAASTHAPPRRRRACCWS